MYVRIFEAPAREACLYSRLEARNSKMIYFLRTGRNQRRQTGAWVKQNMASLVSGPSEMMAEELLYL
jgi:hypothetical protein